MVAATDRLEQWQVATVCAAAVGFVGARFAAESYIAGIFGALAGASSAGCYYLCRERTDLRSRLTSLNETDRKEEQKALRETKQKIEELTSLEAEKDKELQRLQKRVSELSEANDELIRAVSEAGENKRAAINEVTEKLNARIVDLEQLVKNLKIEAGREKDLIGTKEVAALRTLHTFLIEFEQALAKGDITPPLMVKGLKHNIAQKLNAVK